MLNKIYVLAAIIAASAIAGPVMAKSIHQRACGGEQAMPHSPSSVYAKATTHHYRSAFVNPFSPAATGGGSIGYNEKDPSAW